MKKTILLSAIITILSAPAFAEALDPQTVNQRHQAAYDYREARAAARLATTPSTHESNSDEVSVADFQGQFHKALPHDANGVVDANVYNQYLDAIASGSFAAFEALPLPGPVKLANPLAAQIYDLEGRDSHDYGLAIPPSVSSAEAAAEMVEVYHMALTRDVKFSSFGSDPLIAKAAGELAGMTDYKGRTSKAYLFRGPWAGETSGPYISQFLYKDIPYGPKTIDQKYNTYAADVNFMTSFNEWLAIQNGTTPTQNAALAGARYIINGRDIGYFVHKDFTYQGYLNAALILVGFGPNALDDGNPYKTAAKQGAFIDQGAPEILDMVARAGNAGLRAAWFQKWNVHRRLRPEAYGGLAQTNPSLLHTQFTSSMALADVQTKYGSPLLPMAYPESAPTHPSYPADHAAISGACATVLKAFFKEDALIPSPVKPSSDGSTLEVYSGPLTIEGELNKLASNISIGRDWAGVHYYSDGVEGMRLGEKVGIAILKDWRDAHPQAPALTLKKFDGTVITI
ncbi:MAG: hypothetical protein ACXW1W_00670 [Methylococcaceae bacterium]